MLKDRYIPAILLGLAICLALWWGASRAYPAFVVPSPSETLRAALALIADAEFWQATLLPTLGRACIGGLIAACVGVSLGLLAEHSPFLNGVLEPPRLFLSAMPAPVFVILALLWVGAQDLTIILTVAVMLVPLFFVAARDGLRGRDTALLEMARVYEIRWLQVVRLILAPAVSVSLIPASRVAIANALRLTVLAEILVATGGIGERIALARQYLETEDLFALVLLLVGMIAFLEWALARWSKAPGGPG